jgi:hypothetical protein
MLAPPSQEALAPLSEAYTYGLGRMALVPLSIATRTRGALPSGAKGRLVGVERTCSASKGDSAGGMLSSRAVGTFYHIVYEFRLALGNPGTGADPHPHNLPSEPPAVRTQAVSTTWVVTEM